MSFFSKTKSMDELPSYPIHAPITIIRVDLEKFFGRKEPVRILTLSCSYLDLLDLVGQHESTSTVQVCVHGSSAFMASGVIAMVHPMSAPAMISIPADLPAVAGLTITVSRVSLNVR